MKLGVKKLHEKAIIPTYGSKDAAGFDLYALETVTVPAGQSRVIKTGIALDIPKDHEVQIRPRSGVSAKTALRISNAPGTIDSDYTGEIMILIDNIDRGIDDYKITAGDRVAQGVLCPVIRAEIKEIKEIKSTERGDGGLGSTGMGKVTKKKPLPKKEVVQPKSEVNEENDGRE